MKKFLLGTILLALGLAFPQLSMARVNVGISIALPPLVVFAEPPQLVVLPETNVYVVPDLEMDIFFYNGWWWRSWEDRWYRSRNYNSGWGHYRKVPSFYRQVPPGWRDDYREKRWKGHQWDNERIPHQQVKRNWRNWEKSRHWEKQNTWGVKNLRSRTESGPGHREVHSPSPELVRPQHIEPKNRNKAPQSEPRHEKSGREKEEKRGRN